MPAPTISTVYPNPGSTGIPIGAEIQITFDEGIDLSTGKSNVVIYGADFDKTSGPDSAAWIDPDTLDNPFFLKSPGFSGIVECNYSVVYVDTNGLILDPQPTVLTAADELANGYRHRLVVEPKSLLAPNVNYVAYIIGDSEGGTSNGVSHRTVFDVDNTGVTSATGGMSVYGGYTGTADTVVNVRITSSGDIGTAQYRWWYDTDIEANAVNGRVTSRRYRRLEDGVQVRFTGSGFVANDLYRFDVVTPQFLAQSYQIGFSTGTGSVQEVPETASTSIIGTSTALTSTVVPLTVTDMDPPDGSTHINTDTRTVTVAFSGDLDPATITDANVTVLSYPVSGVFDGPSNTRSDEIKELVKGLTVSNDTLTIDI
jgi:hypothetical protein